jgi:hypothetical protein
MGALKSKLRKMLSSLASSAPADIRITINTSAEALVNPTFTLCVGTQR